jgi:NhaA family Na+:H+ antiporter
VIERPPAPGALVRLLRLVLDHSLLLAAGAAAALVWANLDPASYAHATRRLLFLVNDVGMVFFFGLAAKEVYEATLPGGPLASPRTAAVPVIAAVGGMAAPALIYVAFMQTADLPALTRGWAIPCATDIAFSYLVARLIFPPKSAALPFLLLLAIADDAFGLVLLALFYPSGPVAIGVLAACLAPAMALAWALRKSGVTSFWWYLAVPGALAWAGLFLGGIHPALALVPIVPFMPHGRSNLMLFAGRVETSRTSTLQAFERTWKMPVQLVLFLFGFANAGVSLGSAGFVTIAIVVSLVAGKPIGILAATVMAELVGFARPQGLDYRSLIVLGVTAGIGFTVALFFATAAFPSSHALDEAKMGALVSLGAAPVAWILGRVLRVASPKVPE